MFFLNVLNVQCCLLVACVLEACFIAEERHKQTTWFCNVSRLKDVPPAGFCPLNVVIVLDDTVLSGLPDKQERVQVDNGAPSLVVLYGHVWSTS